MTPVNPTANVGTTTHEAVDAHGHQEMHELLLSPLAKNANVRGAIDEILNQMQTSAQELTGAKPATQAGGELLHAWMERAKVVRSRGGYFPYIGSGRGRGALVELIDGSVKWDMINGIGVHMFGRGDAEVTRACLQAALADVVMEGNLQFNADSIAFAELLIKEASRASALAHCFVTNSGCMANEAALKVCQQNAKARRACSPLAIVSWDAAWP